MRLCDTSFLNVLGSRGPFLVALLGISLAICGTTNAAPSRGLLAAALLGQDEGADDGRGEDTGPPPDPESFDEAYQIAQFTMSQWKEAQKSAAEEKDAAKKAEAEKAANEFVTEAIRMMTVALGNANASTPLDKIHRLRYLLCYTAYQTGRYTEAGLVGESVASSLAKEDAKTALGAGYVALLAYNKLYAATKAGERDFEVERLASVGGILQDNWPDSAQAETARLLVAGQLFANGRPAEAAEWYAKVPAKSPKHTAALLVGGRAAFAAYARAAALEGDEAPTTEELEAMLADAKRRLTEGVKKTEAGLKTGVAPTTNLVQAKYALAQMQNRAGEYDAALKLLVTGPFPVVPATDVSLDTKRPATGVRSRDFAASVQELLLRTYVGLGKLDEAQAVIKKLEKLGGDTTDVSAVYVNLGRQLRTELERLQDEGDADRIKTFVGSFEKLLAKLAEQKDSLDAGSLEFVATTYVALGEGLEDEETSTTYFGKAAEVYDEMANRARADAKFLSPARLLNVQLDRAETLALAGRADDALETVGFVLLEKPSALNAQQAAARILEAKGDLDAALTGAKAKNGANIWGWSGIDRRLEKLVLDGNASDYVRQQHFEARYQVAAISRQLAIAADSTSRLKIVKTHITQTARTTANLSDEEWQRLDELYQEVQTDLGEAPTPLERPEPVNVTEPDDGTAADSTTDTDSDETP